MKNRKIIKNKKRKGFTLIELLAVILILGVIALIAVPTITSVIEDSKKASIKSTADVLVDAVEKQCQLEQLKQETITNSYTIVDGEISKELDIKNYPQSGQITVDDECNAEVAINDGTYCVFASGDNSTITSDIANCTLENMPVPDTSESCFIFDEATRTITGYDFDNAACPSDISIPATINNFPVEHIADYAFFSETYNYMLAYSVPFDLETDYETEENIYTYSKIENTIPLGLTPVYLQPINILNASIEQNCYATTFSTTYDRKPMDYVASKDDGYALCTVAYASFEEGKDYEFVTSKSVTSLDLSKATNLISIGDGAFMRNTIEKVIFGNLPKLTSIGLSAFTGNNLKGTLDLSGLTNLIDLSSDIFSKNDIVEVKFPANLKTIGIYTFYGNQILTLNLPEGLIAIRRNSFGSNLLKTIEIPNTVKYLSGFSNNLINEISIPDSVEKIKTSAFNINNLSSLTLNENIKGIGENAFANNEIDGIKIPNNIEIIGDYCFDKNPLTYVTFGSGISAIGAFAFGNGKSTIDTVVILDDWLRVPGLLFYNTKINNLILGKNVKHISQGAFYGSGISNITWSESLLTIEDYAFYQSNVENLVIPSTVTSIGAGAFAYLGSQTIVIPDSVETIYYSAFLGQNADTITIGSGVKTIGGSNFGCYNHTCHAKITVAREKDSISGACWEAGGTSTIAWSDGVEYECATYNKQ